MKLATRNRTLDLPLGEARPTPIGAELVAVDAGRMPE
jgi:hypothetical protein